MVNNRRLTNRVIRWALIGCLGFILAAPGSVAAQAPYSGIVVFGTSLSDSGNAFALRGAVTTPPDFDANPLLIPSAPYAKGGHHFSNGATWIEQYAKSVGLSHSVKAALGNNDPVATNFAVGSARSYNDGENYNLSQQVSAFLQRSNNVASAQALYVIEMGGNDVRDAIAIYSMRGDGGAVIAQALGAIAANIQRLYLAGARNFLIMNVPNVGLTPAIRSLGPVAVGLATQVTQGFNAGLAKVVRDLGLALPGTSFVTLDAYGLLSAIVASPATFDLTSVATACLTPNVAPFTCQDADSFLFWDGIHPTKAGHAILAGQAAEIVR